MKRAAIVLLLLLAPVLSSAQAKATFDKFKNVTYFKTEETQAGNVTYDGGKDGSLLVRRTGMIVAFNCQGQVQHCRPSIIELLFIGYTSDWIMNGNNVVNLLIDDKPASAGKAEWDGQVLEVDNLVEYNDTNISLALFKRLAGAKSVDVQVAGFEFSLTDANLAAIRDLASHAE